jgi:hypothetical protein
VSRTCVCLFGDLLFFNSHVTPPPPLPPLIPQRDKVSVFRLLNFYQSREMHFPIFSREFPRPNVPDLHISFDRNKARILILILP